MRGRGEGLRRSRSFIRSKTQPLFQDDNLRRGVSRCATLSNRRNRTYRLNRKSKTFHGSVRMQRNGLSDRRFLAKMGSQDCVHLGSLFDVEQQRGNRPTEERNCRRPASRQRERSLSVPSRQELLRRVGRKEPEDRLLMGPQRRPAA